MHGSLLPTCGNCRFSQVLPQDMTKRFCHGVPPTPVAVPVPRPPGGLEVRVNMMCPVVEARQPGCALYQPSRIGTPTEAKELTGVGHRDGNGNNPAT